MIRSRTSRLVALAAGCVLLAVPAGASAGPKAVNKHVNKADRHLAKAESFVERGRDARAAKAIERANNQTKRAFRKAKRLKRTRAVARGERKVALQYDQHVDSLIALIDELRPAAQDFVADEVTEAVDGRERALTKLTELLDQVPEQGQRGLSRAIAAIQAGNGEELDELLGAVEQGEIAAGALPATGSAIEAVTASIETAVARLQELADQLPPQARDKVLKALERIEGVVADVLDRIGGDFGIPGLPPIGMPELPGLPGAVPGVPEIPGMPELPVPTSG